MSSDVAIAVENLSKCYQIYDKPHQRLMQMLWHGRRNYYHEFWALRDVSFEVRRGEAIGIVGRNGSGKSTLLQLICGTLHPTAGQIQTNGRIAALLELGSGFNPDFTGRENVYMNATILGLSQEEIEARFDDIAAFADIGAFIEQPVKMYSSGMFMRLAFAVQAMVDPDILIVDEALSVGDVRFQGKCFDRLRRLKEAGTSILLVTHSTDQIVTHCNRAILIDNGRMVEMGKPKRIANLYLDMLFGRDISRQTDTAKLEQTDNTAPPATIADVAKADDFPLDNQQDVFSTHPNYNEYEYRWGDRAAEILDFYLEADGIPYPSVLVSGQLVTLAISIRFLRPLVAPILGIEIKTKEGVRVYGTNSELLNAQEFRDYGKLGTIIHAVARFSCRLATGDYFISLGIATHEGAEVVPHDRRYDSIHLHVAPTSAFYGLTTLDLDLTSSQIP